MNSMASRLTKSASLQPLTWSHSNVGFLITCPWKPTQAFRGPEETRSKAGLKSPEGVVGAEARLGAWCPANRALLRVGRIF